MPNVHLSSGVSPRLCTQFYPRLWAHLFARRFPQIGWQLLASPECAWCICVHRIWHSGHRAWHCKQECSEGLNMRFPLWARVGKGGFLGRGIMGHRWGRRKGTLEAVPSLLSTFLLPAIGACVRVCVCVLIWLWGLPGTVASGIPWVRVMSSSRIHYPSWSFCCCSAFAIYFTEYWHHASSEGIITLSEMLQQRFLFYSPWIPLYLPSIRFWNHVLGWPHFLLWPLFSFSLRFSLRLRNHLIISYHNFL